jgi:hypothetical protein
MKKLIIKIMTISILLSGYILADFSIPKIPILPIVPPVPLVSTIPIVPEVPKAINLALPDCRLGQAQGKQEMEMVKNTRSGFMVRRKCRPDIIPKIEG